VVRNGSHRPREVLTSAGVVEVTAPRVNDRGVDPETGERARFASAILPPWCRRTPKISEVLPLLYLHGLSSGDFVPALGQFLGSSTGLSAPVITKLTETWKTEQRTFSTRDLSDWDYIYLWVDGIHVNIRLEEHKLCLLVMIGVRTDGRKELVALADGYRESAESWADLLRDCARRGMHAPVLAIGDGALGSGVRYARCSPRRGNSAAGSTRSPTSSGLSRAPRTRGRRRRWPRSGTPRTNSMPSTPWPRSRPLTARSSGRRSRRSPTISRCYSRSTTTRPSTGSTCGPRTPSLESTFATVRHRTKITRGPGSRAAGLAMAFKLIEAAQDRWRAVNAPHLVALVRAGAVFVNGKLVERPDEHPQPEAA
jgi:Transposase, Mutator family